MPRPAALLPGDTVAVVSPAGPAPRARREAGLAALAELGFRYEVLDSEDATRGYLSGSDDSRVSLLVEEASDERYAGIWCMRGGYGSVRLLERGLPELGRRPVIGFSDITALLLNLGVPAYHGPVVTQLADIDDASKAQLLAMLAGDTTRIPFAEGHRFLRAGNAEGPLAGGNLSILCSLIGTRFFPDLDGALLFIEDVGEAPFRVDRMLTQLRMCGALGRIRGLMIGAFSSVPDALAADFDSLFEEVAGWVDGPVMRGFPIGHVAHNMLIPLGISARFSAGNGHLMLLE